METDDSEYMMLALVAAQEAAAKGEVPVGAIIVAGGTVVGRGYNCREERQDRLRFAAIE